MNMKKMKKITTNNRTKKQTKRTKTKQTNNYFFMTKLSLKISIISFYIIFSIFK